MFFPKAGLVLGFIILFGNESVYADFNCPLELINGCICFESIRRLICDAPPAVLPQGAAQGTPKVIPPLNFKGNFSFETIEIRNAPDLSFITEYLHVSNSTVQTDTLIIRVPKDAKNDDKSRYNIELLFPLAVNSLQIFVAKDIEKPLSLNIDDFPDGLTEISLSHATLEGVDLKKFSNLKQFKLVGIDIVADELFFDMKTLTRLVITGSKTITGVIAIKPNECASNERIYIDLTNNEKLADFDFTTLNLGKTKCLYHIDFSGSKQLKKDLFTTYKVELAKVVVEKANQLYMIFRDVPLTCTKCMYDIVKPRKDFIHSIQCENIDNAYLLDLTAAQQQLEKFTKCTP